MQGTRAHRTGRVRTLRAAATALESSRRWSYGAWQAYFDLCIPKTGIKTTFLLHGNGGREEMSGSRDLHRQKRQAASSVEYTVAVEIHFADSSLQNTIKSYLNNLSFSLNDSDPTEKISSIQVTTVCNSTGNNGTRCCCEDGYGWASKVCNPPACPNITAAAEEHRDCITQLPSQGLYCQRLPTDSGDTYITKMDVRLKIPFQEALKDPSSNLYKQYTRDLDRAFTVGYGTLQDFISAKVTEYKNGSTVVDYEVTSARAILVENANAKVAEALNSSYNLDPASFRAYSVEVYGGTNISISPKPVFKGDTVTMRCESRSNSNNVTWSFGESNIINGSRHYITSAHSDGKSISVLKIQNITLDDSGSYSCAFTDWDTSPTTLHVARSNITVSLIQIVKSEDIVMECNGESRELSCCVDMEISFFDVHWKPNGAINISGTNYSTYNCTHYLLRANKSECPADKSGTTTTYTCELSTADGARKCEHITVKYLRKANVTLVSSANGQVSQGHNFSLSCRSDVSNYDRVSWEIQNGNLFPNIDSRWYKTQKTPNGAESELEVPRATQNWTGTYTCTFFQAFLNSSARLTMKVFPLPLQQNIIRDPIEATVPCPGTQVLKCCIPKDPMENYTVAFKVGNTPVIDRENTIACNRTDIGVGENGIEVVKPCPERDSSVRGNITYKCEKHTWVVHRNSCLSVPVNNLVNNAESLVSSPAPSQELPAYLEKLNNTVKTEQKDISNSSADLEAVVGILNTISVIPVEAKKEIVENFLSTVDTVINAPTDTWSPIQNGTSQLLDSVEQFSNSLMAVNNTIPSVSLDNIQLQGVVLDNTSVSDYDKNFMFSSSNLSGNVLIDKEQIKKGELFQSTIISVAYSDLSHIIPQHEQTKELINGLVISTVVKANKSEPFQIQMTFAKMNESLIKPRCVFWNFNFSGDRGDWDSSGCKSTNNEENVSCSCDHLTSFSMLMSPAGRADYDESQWQALSYITYIGVGVSILSLVVCIVIEALVWKSVTKTRISYMRHVCILNVAISLLLADIWFVVIAAREEDGMETNICTAATFFVHFFYLCVFFWMLSLSLMLFYHLVFILHNTSQTIMKAVAFCLGYGCPLVISAITIAVTLPQDSYKRGDVCFLNWDKSYALLALVVPALVIVAINVVITIVVIAKIPIRSIGERPRNDERSSIYRITKSIGVLTPLLGLTWGFGLVTIFKQSSIVFHIIFNVFNAFQGLFILLFGILWDRKVREALVKKCSLPRWSSQTSKSSSQGLSAPMISISSPFSRAFNCMFGKAGKYQVSTESASSSSENTSKEYSLLT
uniref:adhesion G protein-coupled receptor F5 n=1 Tax=Euleptes europaea TaxID=460621 RepID=UPI002542277B|nr:adhesion G protein-coupled receptor F5 [Euleptes europaea]